MECQAEGRVLLEMGSSLLDPRRKRRRTRAHSAGLRHPGDNKHCRAISLPWVAVLFGLGMVVVVGAWKWVKISARDVARAARMRDKRAYPLALLLEQHDIEPQVCIVKPACLCVVIVWGMRPASPLSFSRCNRKRRQGDLDVDINLRVKVVMRRRCSSEVAHGGDGLTGTLCRHTQQMLS